MCGLAGIFYLNSKTVTQKELQPMAAAMAHRGPDGESFFTEENIGLAHRRLIIIDTSANATQPMQSNNKEWVIVFNGCIYNYQVLKKELQQKGFSFSSTSDTEVIVEGLAAEGVSFFEKLNGMFAIAAWNTKTKELWLSRDRYGIKPLYYFFHNGVFLFASEIKAFLKHSSFKTALDAAALNEYFTFQNLFGNNTLFKNVQMLPAATTAKISATFPQLQCTQWWDYNFSEVDTTMDFETAKNETEKLLAQAVQRQMISDVPLGSYLSGGMDSASITTIAAKQQPHIKTFTAGFEMQGVYGAESGYDESEEAAVIAKLNHTNHHQQIINAGHLKLSLPKVVWHLEDLKVGMCYPNYYISQLAAKHVKVCLQGTGGDELYGGYPWRYYRVFNSLDKPSFYNNYYNFWQRLVPDEEKKNLFTASIFNSIDKAAPRQSFENIFAANSHLQYQTPEQHIQNSLYFEAKTFLPGLFLVGDKLSMANGLEERFPFMDNDLVNFAQRVPVKHKLANLEIMKRLDENEPGNKIKKYQQYDEGKNVLRQAMKDILPSETINRKKQGFSAPDESWYRGPNAEYIKELLLGKNIASAAFINPAYVKKIIDEHINKRINHRLLLWSLLCFEWWCRIFLNNEQLPE